ncbi:SH3 domain-containing protein [Crocosphaera sp.]|uniref:SH3 domain-containing protein n=1 Tax=Crocosphaera sp. TaxID=2729996 RepID=UPI00263A1B42|nr:SH3 domain-containing protein [Crocosphaera sp.]MDJ0581137.1 SH3 domain-containing protein [Crocosphaera sp.]
MRMLSTDIERKNPYIVGRPIYEVELFFGRRKVFKFIEDNLQQNVQVILLHGQRRIGKSSILMQIPNFVRLDEFVFIYFDLHDKTRLPLDKLLQKLASTIVNKVNYTPKEQLPSSNYTTIFSTIFLPQVIDYLEKKNIKMVWLLDEFDVLNEQPIDSSVDSFFPYLRELITQHKNNLFIIPVVGRRIDDLTNFKSLFKQAPNQEIGLLEKFAAKDLIQKPAEKYFTYNSGVIDAILELSGGHPYFIQVICYVLFLELEAENKSEITRDDVRKIIDDAIEISEGGLTWFRDGLPVSERVVFSACATAEKLANQMSKSAPIEPLRLLEDYGVSTTESLTKAPENLVKWGFLERVENHEFSYKIKIKLVSYWLVKRYPLRQAIWELEKVDLSACKLFELAESISENRKSSIVDLYESILKINPNYFTALFKLAENYLDNKHFRKALKKSKRAYKVDPTRAYEEYTIVKRKTIIKDSKKIALYLGFILALIGFAVYQGSKIQKQFAKNTQIQIKLKEEIATLKEENAILEEEFRIFSSFEVKNATIRGQPGEKNIRSGPGLEYRVSATAHTGTPVRVIDSARNSDHFLWYKIEVPELGIQGWIASHLLTIDGQYQSQTGSSSVSNGTNGTVTGNPPRTKNMRSGAGTVYRIVGTVQIGDRVRIASSSYDRGGYLWYQVYHPKSGKRGWISGQLVNRD